MFYLDLARNTEENWDAKYFLKSTCDNNTFSFPALKELT